MARHRFNPTPTGLGPWVFCSAPAWAAASLGLVAAGCRAGPKNFDNENDALRREVTELRSEVARLNAENTDLKAQAFQAIAALRESGSPAAQVIASMPRCAAVEIGPRSGLKRDDPRTIEVLVETLDARRRFVQVAGTLTIDVTMLGGAGEPSSATRRLGAATLAPDALREAYRSSFMGTHYAVTLPLDEPAAPGATLVLRAVLDDAVTGRMVEATRVIQVR